MVKIRDEVADDVSAREALLDASFGEARFEKTSERLREGRRPARGLALSASHEGALAGTVRLWNVAAGRAGAGLLLGPLAVDEDRRGLGLGHAYGQRDGRERRARHRGHGQQSNIA